MLQGHVRHCATESFHVVGTCVSMCYRVIPYWGHMSCATESLCYRQSFHIAGTCMSLCYRVMPYFRDVYVIPVFVWVLAFAIVFALQVIQPVVALLTFAKGSLLLGTVSLAYSYSYRGEQGCLLQSSVVFVRCLHIITLITTCPFLCTATEIT